MKNFLFKKNLWLLDLFAVLSFSFLFSYKFLRDSVTGEPKWSIILVGTCGYILTFFLAIILQTKIKWLRSWIWLGIIGALFRVLILLIINFPNTLIYHQKFSQNTVQAIGKITIDSLSAIFFNWILFAIFGLLFIFSFRLLLYFLQPYSKFVKEKETI